MDENEVHMDLRARAEAVAELPAARKWSVDFTPSVLADHVEEDFVPGSRKILGGMAPASHAPIETLGSYVLNVFTLANRGYKPMRDITKAILAAFPPGDARLLPSGDRLEIRGDSAPWPSQILRSGNNKSRCTVTIPWRVWSQNAA